MNHSRYKNKLNDARWNLFIFVDDESTCMLAHIFDRQWANLDVKVRVDHLVYLGKTKSIFLVYSIFCILLLDIKLTKLKVGINLKPNWNILVRLFLKLE